ncbi:WD40-repeat-containing domain protein [Mortierella sp. GBAus27b]|nr:WD40-repeat-containing domain protein [Mortierella sp. GBAus27b]
MHTQTCEHHVVALSKKVNKFYARMASDNTVWRAKSTQHPLFSERHIQGRHDAVPWLAYYKFLHRNSLSIKKNWADARPQAVHVLEGHTGLVTSLELSMWTLVTASIDSTLRVWDLRTLQCLRVLHSKHSLTCVSQAVGAGVASARTSFGGLYIWDLRTGELIMKDDTAMPHIASFMYMDERYIGYGQCDGAVTVFDWSSRTKLEVVGSYHAHEGDVIHISILSCKYVISAGTSGEILVYSLEQSRVVERILLPHAAQAIQFTPTIHGDKVMFSTRDAVYEYELMLDPRRLEHEQDTPNELPTTLDRALVVQSPEKESHATLTNLAGNTSIHWADHVMSDGSTSTQTGMIRQRVGGTGKAHDQERLIVPTRFPRQASIYCLPRTCRTLDHGTTSARNSYGVFMPNHCTHLNEICVYTRTTKQVKQIRGPAVDGVLAEATRNRFYTTMECNQHCAVVSSGNKVFIISFLPPGV